MDKRLYFIRLLVGLFIAIHFLNSSLFAQEQQDFPPKWHFLQKGLFYRQVDAPEKSILNDSKFFILKADPRKCIFRILSATENKRQNKTADLWAKDSGMNVVVNAGMFYLSNHLTNKGYLKNYSHFNNSRLRENYHVMMAMNPKVLSDTTMIITDMTCRNWESVKLNYQTLCQGMRMIDGHGNPLAWDKRPGQLCSMVIGATDKAGNIYFIFSRSPYSANDNFFIPADP